MGGEREVGAIGSMARAVQVAPALGKVELRRPSRLSGRLLCHAQSSAAMLRSRLASSLARSVPASAVAAAAPAVGARVASPLARSAPTPRLARSVQTTADSTSLVDHGEESIKVKLHEEYFKAHRCDAPALELEVQKQQLVDIYREMVQCVRQAVDQLDSKLTPMRSAGCAAWRWPQTRCAAANRVHGPRLPPLPSPR